MKKIITFLIVLASMIQYGFTQSDSVLINELTKKTVALQTSVDAIKKELIDSLKPALAKKECNCVPFAKFEPIGFWKRSLIASPFLLLILVVVLVAIRLRNFKFTEALTENEPPKKVIKNPEYNASVIAANATIPNLSILFPTTIEVSNIESTLSELQDILKAKQGAAFIVKDTLKKANDNKNVLDAEASTAKTDLESAMQATVALAQAVTDAKAQLDAADQAGKPDKQKLLDDANKAVTDNEAQLTAAKEKIKAADENDATIKTLTDLQPAAEAEVEAAAANVKTAEVAVKLNSAYSINTYRPSISRYMAFITSMVIIIIVVCMSSFFIYHYIRTGCPPEFGALTTMLIVLGLGITPYITNKISTAATVDKP